MKAQRKMFVKKPIPNHCDYKVAHPRKCDIGDMQAHAWYKASCTGNPYYLYDSYHSFRVVDEEPDCDHIEVTPTGSSYFKERVIN
jgi:hypothetical protein